ncbi:MAG: hypothetical protein JXA91_03730 [Candidatus Thermoplasmatota archaeon]|nr:hypothetical protein [Candidatus Thermoplasmatota archaeon]
MNEKFWKIGFTIIVIFSLFSQVSAIHILQTDNSTYQNSTLENESSHKVFCELAVNTELTNSAETAKILQEIYESKEYDFQYITYVSDQYPQASDWLSDEYNVRGFPTCFFDGGFEVLYNVPALKDHYENKIYIASYRNVYDLDVFLNTRWFEDCCSQKLDIEINVKNNEETAYNGILKVYIVERNSRWTYQSGENNESYKYAFLDFAMDERIIVPAGENVTFAAPTWVPFIFDGVDGGEIVAIAVLSDQYPYKGYSDPPYNEYSFSSHAVDEVAVKKVRRKTIKSNPITIEKPLEKMLQILQRFLFRLSSFFHNINEIMNKVF